MNLSKQDKDTYVREVVLKSFQFFKHFNVGTLIFNTDYNILEVNKLCQSRFGKINLVGTNNIKTSIIKGVLIAPLLINFIYK